VLVGAGVLSEMVVSGGCRGKVACAYLVVDGAVWMVYSIVRRSLPFASFLSICPTTAFKGLMDGLLSLEGGVGKERPI
jgi:hypothetical protein